MKVMLMQYVYPANIQTYKEKYLNYRGMYFNANNKTQQIKLFQIYLLKIKSNRG